MQVLVGAGLVVGGLLALKHRIERPITHISSGAQRRKLHPVDKGIGDGAVDVLASKEFSVKRQFHKLRNGEQIFYQTMTAVGKEATDILVFLHGYTSHSDFYLETMAEVARQGCMVVLLDLPCHGRSDGLLCYIPDWWTWVDKVWEFMDDVVKPLRTVTGKPRKLFLSGMSLGGGLTACMGVMRPTYFDGLIPIAPMLLVSDEVKPPLIVQILFRRLLGPFKFTWPVTPSKDLDHVDFRVPEQGKKFTKVNPLSMFGLKPRVASAIELGFTFPEWMEQNLKSVKSPILIMHGAMDKVTDPTMSERMYVEAAAQDKTLKLYEGAYHCELLCCLPGHEKLLNVKFLPEQLAQTTLAIKDMTDWIAARR